MILGTETWRQVRAHACSTTGPSFGQRRSSTGRGHNTGTSLSGAAPLGRVLKEPRQERVCFPAVFVYPPPPRCISRPSPQRLSGHPLLQQRQHECQALLRLLQQPGDLL